MAPPLLHQKFLGVLRFLLQGPFYLPREKLFLAASLQYVLEVDYYLPTQKQRLLLRQNPYEQLFVCRLFFYLQTAAILELDYSKYKCLYTFLYLAFRITRLKIYLK